MHIIMIMVGWTTMSGPLEASKIQTPDFKMTNFAVLTFTSKRKIVEEHVILFTEQLTFILMN